MGTIRANVPLQFGLVSVPVNVMSAVKDPKEEVSLNVVCDGNDKPHTVAQIQSVYRCPLCSNEDKEKMKKGRNLGGGNFTLTTEEEVAKTIFGKDDEQYQRMALNIHSTEDVCEVTPAGSLYYLAPTAASGASYNLLVRLFKDNPEYTALIKWAVKTRLALYRVLVLGDVLAIEKLAWPEDVNPAPVAPPYDVDKKMMEQAKALLAMTATPFDLVNYRDDTRAGLAAWIAAQVPVQGIATTDKPTEKATTNSLEQQLQDMLAAAQTPAATKSRRARTKPVEVKGKTAPVQVEAKPRARKAVTPKG